MFSRYALVWCLLAYMAGIFALHAMGVFPRAGIYEISRLCGASVMTLEGTVQDRPVLRWGQTRFLFKGCAVPLRAFCGDVMVTLPGLDRDIAPGDRLRVRGWLAPPQKKSRSYWSSRRVYAFLKVWYPDGYAVLKPASPWSLQRAAWRFQNRYRDFWEARLPWRESALLLGVTVGAQGLLPPAVKEACIRAGVYHIVVVSGQNMSLLVTLGLLFLLALAIPRRYALWICLPVIIFYTSAVGADPPVVRAAVTAVVGLLVSALGRDVPSYYPLCIAASWILVEKPQALLGASFQLSFSATLSILLMHPLWEPLKGRTSAWRRWWVESVCLGLAVYMGIWPMLVFYFQRLSLAGLLANWTIFPLSALLMVLGLLVGSWGAFWPHTVPHIVSELMRWLLALTLAVIERMAGWSWAIFAVSTPPLWAIGLYYAGLFGILIFVHRRKLSR